MKWPNPTTALLRLTCLLALTGLAATTPAHAASSSASSTNDIVIGQVASLSGNNGADLGLGLRDGIRAYFARVNAVGGINGRKLRLVSRDDKYDPAETVAQTKALIADENPIALVGYRGTANTLALVKDGVLQSATIALVGTLTGAKELQGAPNIYHVRTSYRDEISRLVYQLGRLQIKRISVLYADDAFGKSGLEAVRLALANGSQQPVEVAAYDKAPDKVRASLIAAADKLSANTPQAVVMVAVGEPVYEFIKLMRERNGAIGLYGISVVNPDTVLEKVGVTNARGIGFSQVFPFPYVDSVRVVQDYRQALKKYVPEAQASYFSLEGYISARVLVEAIRRAGNAPDRAKVIDALNRLPELDLGGFFVKFHADTRNGSSFTELTIISGYGKLLK